MLFGCPTTNFGTLLKGQSHKLDAYHCMFTIWSEGHKEPCNKFGSLNQATRLVGFDPFDSFANRSPTRPLYSQKLKKEHQKKNQRGNITEKILIFHWVLTDNFSFLRILHKKTQWQITKSLKQNITKLKVQILQVLTKISNLMSKISWAFNRQDWEIKKLRTHAQFSTDLLIYIKYSYLKNMN